MVGIRAPAVRTKDNHTDGALVALSHCAVCLCGVRAAALIANAMVPICQGFPETDLALC